MAPIFLRITTAAGSTTGTRTLSDANANRILAAHRSLYGVSTSQEALDIQIQIVVGEMIGNTKTTERMANAIPDIPVT